MNCYRFPSKKIFYELAQSEGLLTEDGQLITDGHGFAIDEIGVITQGGEWDPETGEVLVPPVALDGHHCNLLGIAPESFDEFLVVVNTPVRIFLGGPTQAPSTDILEQITQ